MKKTLLTIAIVLGMTIGAVAQEDGGGLFGMGPQRSGYSMCEEQTVNRGLLGLPTQHGLDDDQTPLGTGALLLIGFGAAYALKKKEQIKINK